ncbi:hypothetical protein CHS0354_020493 [Potamilus streckersoni]|uniref:Uncharacterized protein n=1 Tax=Potamilus streckersoni TaxID=2493646 RepID=A0AAE0SZX4_9BIVA|nr:hypothetical protein CHS0354_020493 [Potamilus streckersoni]
MKLGLRFSFEISFAFWLCKSHGLCPICSDRLRDLCSYFPNVSTEFAQSVACPGLFSWPTVP